MCCEISKLFSRADVCVARYLNFFLCRKSMFCEVSNLFSTADVCVARYLSCSLEKKYVLRDI
jgi:hypothetical protein